MLTAHPDLSRWVQPALFSEYAEPGQWEMLVNHPALRIEHDLPAEPDETALRLETQLRELAAGNWLAVLRNWECDLARWRDRERCLKLLFLISELGRLDLEEPSASQRRCRQGCARILHAHRVDSIPAARTMAMLGLAGLGDASARGAMRIIKHDGAHWGNGEPKEAIFRPLLWAIPRVLARVGTQEDWYLLTHLLSVKRPSVRKEVEDHVAAFNRRAPLSDETAAEIVDCLLGPDSGSRDSRSLALDASCLKIVREYRPDLFPALLAQFCRKVGTDRIARLKGIPEILPYLEALIRKKKAGTTGLANYMRMAPDRVLPLIKRENLLCSYYCQYTELVLKAIEKFDAREEFVREVIAGMETTRFVRLQGHVRILAATRHPLALGELVSRVGYADSDLGALARKLLDSRNPPAAVLGELHRLHPDCRHWKDLRARVLETLAWGEAVGERLLGRSTRLFTTAGGLGYTVPSSRTGLVNIWVNDRPLTCGVSHGEKIVKALILHEIAHHLYDFSQKGFQVVRRGPVARERLGLLFNLILDERIERLMRDDLQGSGVYFDRLAAFAFTKTARDVSPGEMAKFLGMKPGKLLEGIQAGRIPGRVVGDARKSGARVVLRPADLVCLPGYAVPFQQFALMLRAKFPRTSAMSRRALEAIELVPDDLRRLDHHQILDLVRKLGKLLGKEEKVYWQVRRLRQGVLTRLPGGLVVALSRVFEGSIRHDVPTSQLSLETFDLQPQHERWRKELENLRPQVRKSQRISGRKNVRASRWYDKGSQTSFKKLKVAPWPADNPPEPVGDVTRPARVLRNSLRRNLARITPGEPALKGHRLDPGRLKAVATGIAYRCLVGSREEPAYDLALGVLIDRSGSMHESKLMLARTFAALLCEGVGGFPGIQGFLAAFDDAHYWELGSLRGNRSGSLVAGGGNNDAGALWEASRRVKAIRARQRAVVMISDGLPTECTESSLARLVADLERQGLICVQVAVDALPTRCFTHFVDLSCYPLDLAVARFGRMLSGLIAGNSGKGQTHALTLR